MWKNSVNNVNKEENLAYSARFSKTTPRAITIYPQTILLTPSKYSLNKDYFKLYTYQQH